MAALGKSERINGGGNYRPLDDSLRIAFTELVHWIHNDYGLSEMDAYRAAVQGSDGACGRNGGPDYVVVAKLERRSPAEEKIAQGAGAGRGLSG